MENCLLEDIVYRLKSELMKMLRQENIKNCVLCVYLGMTCVNFNTYLSRKKIPYSYIINFCIRFNVSIDYIFKGSK